MMKMDVPSRLTKAHEALNSLGFQCVRTMSDEARTIETWARRGGKFVLLEIYKPDGGWELYLPVPGLRIEDTLEVLRRYAKED